MMLKINISSSISYVQVFNAKKINVLKVWIKINSKIREKKRIEMQKLFV